MTKTTTHSLFGIDSRIWLIIALTIPVLILTAIEPPIAQDQSYHNFADQRTFFGIPNCFNVVSNFTFLIVGIIGLVFLYRQHQKNYPAFVDKREIIPYLVLFLGITITSFGSAYYHISPNDTHLVLDRVPMTLTFMAFFVITIMERISLKTGLYMLIPFILLGIFSVAYWYAGDLRGSGDLRLYVDVQFYPLLAMPLIVILFPPKYNPDRWIFGVILLYALSKACEIWDVQIYKIMKGYVSGHTLKHLIAAFASYLVVWVLKHREPVV
jgi:hypothetical protein